MAYDKNGQVVKTPDTDIELTSMRCSLDEAVRQKKFGNDVKNTLVGGETTSPPTVAAVNVGLSKKADKVDVDNKLSSKADKSSVDALLSQKANKSDLSSKADKSDLASKQDKLTSGANIKTINNQSILGSGNIVIQGGSGSGDTIVAGTNVTIETLPDGKKKINAEMPAGKVGMATEIGTADGSNVQAKLDELESQVGDVDSINYRSKFVNHTSKAYIADDGTITSDANIGHNVYKCTECDGVFKIDATIRRYLGNGQSTNLFAFYNSAETQDASTFISASNKVGTGVDYKMYSVEVPNDTKCICICANNTNTSQPLLVNAYTSIESRLGLLVKKSNSEIIVDINGNGDYISLADALKYAGDTKDIHKTIIVKSGVYEMPPVLCGSTTKVYETDARNLTIIGEDKNKCIIINNVGFYDNSKNFDYSTLRLSGNVLIENLTIKSTCEKYDEEYAKYNWSSYNTNQKAYCIHIDQRVDEHSIMEMRNCIFINDHNSCIGAGNKQYFTIRAVGCTFESTISSKNEGGNENGTFYVHPDKGMSSQVPCLGQRVELFDNLIVNKTSNKVVYITSNATYNNVQTIIAKNNLCVGADGASSATANLYQSNIEIGYGNNITNLNK